MTRELLFSITKKDFKIDWYSGRGAGGQGRNKLKNCCRLTHLDSGVTKTGQSNKSRKANLNEAFRGLREDPEFKLWFKRKASQFLKEAHSIEEAVEREMRLENLKVECKRDGKWERIL